MKRILSLLMAIIMLSMCLGLIACDDGERKILINGENLAEYTVVIPEECDKVTQYASENFIFLVKEALGLELPVVTDAASPVEKEILIGETNRPESKTNVELKNGEYLLFVSGKKIVMKGYGIYVGGACGDFVNKYIKPQLNTDSSKIKIDSLSDKPVAYEFKFASSYRNVILMIGDGMGKQHVKMAEVNGLGEFAGRSFPNNGSVTTASLSVLEEEIGWTDSAASATAMATGYKTYNAYLGIGGDGATLLNVRELARSKGAKTAVITTDVITGATPSGFLCHHNNRRDTEILQGQIDEITASNGIDYIKGSVKDDLTKETKSALETVSANDSQFFIMIEEAYIDKHSEAHEYINTIKAVKRFNDSVIYAAEFVLCHPDTALIVTADHETGQLTPNMNMGSKYEFKTYHHTNLNVPIFAMGPGTDIFNDTIVDNTDIAKFTALAYSNEAFGDSKDY
ncbi:MAG: alkaline phosphatase [Clostridia bacterium]|nr:alkaline phosphatase [Clostridia bacterium]